MAYPTTKSDPALTDSSSVESETSVSDYDRVPPPVSEADQKLIDMITNNHDDSATDRRPHEGVWFESLAMYLGNQHVAWQSGASRGSLVSTRDPRRPHRVYAVRNKIRPKINKLVARAKSRQIDAKVRPATDSPLDMAAAPEGRAVVAYFDYKFRRQSQLQQLMRYALVTSAAFLKIYWDPNKLAEVPKLDRGGNVVGMTMAQVGDVCEDICPCFEIYPDPKARTWAECRWMIHAKVRSLEDVKERYEDGWMVVPDMGNGPTGYIESRLASVTGDYARGSEAGQSNKQVLVLEYWEKPTKRYPQGRLVVVAGGRVLRNEKWPYKKKDSFPFIPLAYEEGLSTLWPANAVQDLISPQRSYNRGISRIEEHVVTSWGKIMAPVGCTISPTAFDSATPNEVIYYEPGPGVPQHIPAPPMPSFLIDVLHINDSDMNDISGVHEVSDGQLPAADMPAAAIRLLQDSDTTQMSLFTGNIETFHVERATWEIELASEFYTEPRLIALAQVSGDADATSGQAVGAMGAPPPGLGGPMGMPPPGMGGGPMGAPSPGMGGPMDGLPPGMPGAGPVGAPPQGMGGPLDSTHHSPGSEMSKPVMQVMAFRALNAGGAVRVIVEPGSATPKSAEAQAQEVMDLAKAGLLGPIGDPTTTAVVLALLDYANPDPIVEKLEKARLKMMQMQAVNQPNPAQVAAVKAQADQQALHTQLQHEQEALHIKTMAEEHLLQVRHQLESEKSLQDYHQKLSLQQAGSAPKVTIAVRAGEHASALAEEEAGLTDHYGGQDTGYYSHPYAGQDGGFDPRAYAGQDAGFDPRAYAGQDAGFDPHGYGGQDAGVDPHGYAGQDAGFDPGAYAGDDGGFDPGAYTGDDPGSDPGAGGGNYGQG